MSEQRCPYQILQDGSSFLVVRPMRGGGYMTVAGPFASREIAEQNALRRWEGKKVTS